MPCSAKSVVHQSFQSDKNLNRQQITQSTEPDQIYIYILGQFLKKANWSMEYFEARLSIVPSSVVSLPLEF